MKMRRALRSCLQSFGAITNFISTAHDLGSAAQLPNLRGVPPPVTIPLVALLLASGVGVGLLCLRIVLTRHWHQLYLVWNLVLAWLPLLFALLACRLCERRGESLRWKWGFLAAVFAWLIFFPNAPYILTDLVHLQTWQTWRHPDRFWVDLVFILLFAWTGLLLGFISLYLMQSMVARLFGRAAGWTLIPVMAGLSGLGLCMGRFLRWNSWD